jgi:hypothetical protein
MTEVNVGLFVLATLSHPRHVQELEHHHAERVAKKSQRRAALSH